MLYSFYVWIWRNFLNKDLASFLKPLALPSTLVIINQVSRIFYSVFILHSLPLLGLNWFVWPCLSAQLFLALISCRNLRPSACRISLSLCLSYSWACLSHWPLVPEIDFALHNSIPTRADVKILDLSTLTHLLSYSYFKFMHGMFLSGSRVRS